MRILVLYSTHEGQTGRIAERIAQQLAEAGHAVDCHDGDAAPENLDPAAYDAVLVGAAIRYGRHSSTLRKLIRRHRAAFSSRPGAFFSVSLSAGGPGAKPEAAARYVRTFLKQTRWQPELATSFAGALPYTRYAPFTRFLVRQFVRMAGGDIDTSRDYEYTDWKAVEGFTERFLRSLA